MRLLVDYNSVCPEWVGVCGAECRLESGRGESDQVVVDRMGQVWDAVQCLSSRACTDGGRTALKGELAKALKSTLFLLIQEHRKSPKSVLETGFLGPIACARKGASSILPSSHFNFASKKR